MSSLEIIDLKTHFPTPDGIVRAVDAITLSIGEKETFGVIGETGCGKMETGDGHSSEERLRPIDVPRGCRFHTRLPAKRGEMHDRGAGTCQNWSRASCGMSFYLNIRNRNVYTTLDVRV